MLQHCALRSGFFAMTPRQPKRLESTTTFCSTAHGAERARWERCPCAKRRAGQDARERVERVGAVQPEVCEGDDARLRVLGLPLRRRQLLRAPRRRAPKEVQALRQAATLLVPYPAPPTYQLRQNGFYHILLHQTGGCAAVPPGTYLGQQHEEGCRARPKGGSGLPWECGMLLVVDSGVPMEQHGLWRS